MHALLTGILQRHDSDLPELVRADIINPEEFDVETIDRLVVGILGCSWIKSVFIVYHCFLFTYKIEKWSVITNLQESNLIFLLYIQSGSAGSRNLFH